ncbi:hypothetical protein [Stenotrophomonas sp. S39]|uniref:hypothetical protein n=1 Tax=Stenotrophomonas sp. S39 TaxID=2767451 RepID=UPI00190B8ED6|nr:hypothetical protein [Stenotrophomonas sp. S39]MBK0052958.1 hypothetical protein [Stenotrophomonas sp. S39]
MQDIINKVIENGFVELNEVAQLWSREGIVREAIVRAKSRSDDELFRGWEGDLSASFYYTFNWMDASEIAEGELVELLSNVQRMNKESGWVAQ